MNDVEYLRLKDALAYYHQWQRGELAWGLLAKWVKMSIEKEAELRGVSFEKLLGGEMSFRGCSSFWTWLFCTWDVRVSWEGPYRLIRERGIRICGFEFTTEYVQDNDDR